MNGKSRRSIQKILAILFMGRLTHFMRATLRFMRRNPLPFVLVVVNALILLASFIDYLFPTDRRVTQMFWYFLMTVEVPGFRLANYTSGGDSLPWLFHTFLFSSVQWLVIAFGLQAIVRFFRTKPGQTQSKR